MTEPVQDVQDVQEHPPEMSPMDIMRMEADKLEAEEAAAAQQEEVPDEPVQQEAESEEAPEAKDEEVKAEDAEPKPAESELSQAEQDLARMDELFAKRAEKRAQTQQDKPATPIEAGRKESLIARVLTNGDVAAMNELIDSMGNTKFDEMIKHRLAGLGATESTKEPEPKEDPKELPEIAALRKEMAEMKQQYTAQQANAVKEYQLKLIRDTISGDPDEYSLVAGEEEQIRNLALEFMADGQEITPLKAVEIYNNSVRRDLANRLTPAVLEKLGMSQASDPEPKKQSKPTGTSKSQISNSTETNNTPSERDNRDMPVDIHERLDWAFQVAQKENINLE
jgi:hypothetical protein